MQDEKGWHWYPLQKEDQKQKPEVRWSWGVQGRGKNKAEPGVYSRQVWEMLIETGRPRGLSLSLWPFWTVEQERKQVLWVTQT